MKKNVISVILIFVALIAVPLTLIIFAFALPPQYDLSFYGGMKIKYERLYGLSGKKAVIIGGSNAAFGIRSDLLEEELGYPAVNYGLYANLGTKYMLDTAEGAIGSGDIVIISPEQNSQSLSCYFNGEAAWYSADGNFGVLGRVPFASAGDLFKGFLPFVSGKYNAFISGVKPAPDGVYNVSSFNSLGDICYDKREYNEMPQGFDAATPISFSRNVISQEFIDYMNAFARRARAKGATVYYAFCPMNGSALEEGTDSRKIADYYDFLREKLDFDILGSPENRVMDSGWFYDSNFHLNASGAIAYTRRLALDIKAATGDYTAVKIPVPEMPVVPDGGGESGGTSEEFDKAAKVFDLSLITSVSGARVWRIDGLTAEGKALAEITLPDKVLGIPVCEIAAGAFADDTAVEKITFGMNINTVGAGAFAGCTNLKGIYITNPDPNAYHPARDVLQGADGCSFYLPADVYASKFLPDYFWGALDKDRLKSY